jgi:hypothetical protein
VGDLVIDEDLSREGGGGGSVYFGGAGEFLYYS